MTHLGPALAIQPDGQAAARPGTWRCSATLRCAAGQCGTGRGTSRGERWVYSPLLPGLPDAARALADRTAATWRAGTRPGP
jgi:hypothetical protein